MIHALWLIPCIFISVWTGYAVCAMMVVSKKEALKVFWNEWNSRGNKK